ncbi:MAG: GNAT family N-acetyltransferase [Flavisolibacter sp.]
MIVEHKKKGTRGMFFVDYEGEVAAEMIYSLPSADIMMIEHTEVEDVLRGKNIGYELVHAGVEYARHHGLKIIATCPFAKSVLDKKPEWRDVLAE